MTQLIESHTVDSDRVDSGGRLWRPVLATALVGVVVGGLIGLAYGASRKPTWSATTSLSVQPDSTVLPQSQNAPGQDATSFVQSQLVVLNGDQLAAAVRSQLKLSATPQLSATQVGQTYVVQVTATAGSKAQALADSTAAATTYSTQRSTALGGQIDAQLATVNTQLDSVRSALAAAVAAATTTSANGTTTITPTAAQSALQSQYQQLLASSSTLQLARPQVGRVVTVLSPASVPPSSSLSTSVKDSLAGALVGLLLALMALALRRRSSPRIRSVGDLTALGVPVLLPVFPHQGRRARRGPARWRSNAGRLLAARLTRRGAASHSPVIVVGATSGVGTSHVAASLAAGFAERGPVLLVLASELVNGADTTSLVSIPALTELNQADQAEHVEAEHVEAAGAGSHTRADPASMNGRHGDSGTRRDIVRHEDGTHSDPASYDPDEPLKRAMASEIPGVWVLPCGGELARSAVVVPSARRMMLINILQRATTSGWLVVVDAPPLSESDLAVDCAAAYGAAVLVANRAASRPADILSATDLFDAQSSRFLGAILNDAPARWHRPARPTSAEPSPTFEPPRPEAARARPRRRPVSWPGPLSGRAGGASKSASSATSSSSATTESAAHDTESAMAGTTAADTTTAVADTTTAVADTTTPDKITPDTDGHAPESTAEHVPEHVPEPVPGAHADAGAHVGAKTGADADAGSDGGAGSDTGDGSDTGNGGPTRGRRTGRRRSEFVSSSRRTARS